MGNANSRSNNNNFDNLVTTISKDERINLYDKLSALGKNQAEADNNKDENFEPEEEKISLIKKFAQEPFYIKIILWIKAAFSNLSLEDVYNKSLINQLGKEIERKTPGFINYKQKVFLSPFLDKLKELYNIQKSISKYISAYEEDEGAFYLKLGDLINQEFQNQIKAVCDPFQYKLDQTNGIELRNSLLNKLLENIDSMPQKFASQFYFNSRTVEWLKCLKSLPLESFINKFKSTELGEECSFNQVKKEFNELAKVINYEVDFSEDLLKMLYYNYEQKNNSSEVDQIDLAKFVNKLSSDLTLINAFHSTFLVKKMAKVVFNDAVYTIPPLITGENWQKKYQNGWQDYFDTQWKKREKKYKKEVIKRKLQAYFMINEYPEFPYTPWQKMSQIYTFKYEYTLGFMYFFINTIYTKNYNTLSKLALQGDFAIKENRFELTDDLTNVDSLKENLNILSIRLSPSGDFGSYILGIENVNNIKQSAKETVINIIKEIEDNVVSLKEKIKTNCLSLSNILSAASGLSPAPEYGIINNLKKIDGTKNSLFIDSLNEATFNFKYSNEILEELSLLEDK